MSKQSTAQGRAKKLDKSVKTKCKTKAENTSVSAQPFREYASGSTRSRPSRFCLAFNKGKVKGQIADTYMDVPSAKRRGMVSSSAGARQSFPTAEPIREPS